LRALVAGLAVALFLTMWVYVNTRADSKDKYGTFFEFKPTSAKEITQFEAVRYGVNTKDEKVVPFSLPAGTKDPTFVDSEGRSSNSPIRVAGISPWR